MSTLGRTYTLVGSELDREDACNAVDCPNCGSGRGVRCVYVVDKDGRPERRLSSHTGRYLTAVKAGTVPELPGGWRG